MFREEGTKAWFDYNSDVTSNPKAFFEGMDSCMGEVFQLSPRSDKYYSVFYPKREARFLAVDITERAKPDYREMDRIRDGSIQSTPGSSLVSSILSSGSISTYPPSSCTASRYST
jgi:hypothetical protein